MELWQLRTFKVVAETLHFTRASEHLNLSQPAVSRQISSLERETGDKLFVRGKNKKIAVTEHGELVLEYANRLFYQVDQMKRAIDDSHDLETGVLTASTNLVSVSDPFLEVRRGFREIYPGVEIYLKSAKNHAELTNQIRSGECDLGIATSVENTEGLTAIPYGSAGLLPLVGGSHHLANVRRQIDLSELEGEDWILFAKGSSLRDPVDELFLEEGFSPHSIYDSNDPAVVKELIELGNGVGFLPGWSIESDLASGRLCRLLLGVDLSVSLFLLIVENNLSPLLCRHIDFVLEKRLAGVELYGTVVDLKGT